MVGPLANLGVRAPDLDRELEFLRVFGATEAARSGTIPEKERVQVDIGSTRFTLFRIGTYDRQLAALGAQAAGGISHAAFKVGSTERVVEAAAKAGFAPLIPTFTAEAYLGGPSLITYFRSPNGVIVEAKELLPR